MPLHDPNNYEYPTFGESYDYNAGVDSFSEDCAALNANLIGDINYMQGFVANLQSDHEESPTSIGVAFTDPCFDTPTSLESTMESETPTNLVNHSFIDNSDICKMSDGGYQLLPGFCDETNIDDSSQYMEWLADVLPENN